MNAATIVLMVDELDVLKIDSKLIDIIQWALKTNSLTRHVINTVSVKTFR